jgi:hypothetical protein
MAWRRHSGRREAAGDVVGDIGGHLAAVPTTNEPAAGTSPVEAAARARLRGDRFFQIVVDDAALSAYAAATGRRARRSSGATDLLGQIEELGWSLEHVTWWRGAEESEAAAVRGVYLFRATIADAAEGDASGESAAPVSHLPTHRREVL